MKFASTHGMSRSPTYRSWAHMKDRCVNPRNHAYKDYGGRGVALCDKWLSFDGFFEDMGERPSTAHSIDRVNNDGGYDKGNCRWATRSEQQRNKRKYKTNAPGNFAVLCADQVVQIKKEAALGRSRSFARRKASEFGVRADAIRSILRGETWAYVRVA